jgi:hypothetical protein
MHLLGFSYFCPAKRIVKKSQHTKTNHSQQTKICLFFFGLSHFESYLFLSFVLSFSLHSTVTGMCLADVSPPPLSDVET